MSHTNVLLIQSDQHARSVSGAYGDDLAHTPTLDALADHGTTFDAAYCQSPICVPSRASMATGRYPHTTRNWDNATPYIGSEAESWGKRLNDQGHRVTTIGKLHYRSSDDPTGFDDQRLPMHVLDGVGDLYPLLRGAAPPHPASRLIVEGAGSGEYEYTRYDRAVADEAVNWLHNEAHGREKPWALHVSFAYPHFPLVVPEPYLSQFHPDDMRMPVGYVSEEWPSHPAVERLRYLENLVKPFSVPEIRLALSAYYAMVAFLDEQIGRVLNALYDANLESETLVIYTSDHGDMIGQHGLWSKHTMYENSVGVPLILAGPGVPRRKRVSGPTMLVDIFPTIVESVGATLAQVDSDLPGVSLLHLAHGGEPWRMAFSEYHANYSESASYMLREGRYKLVYHVGHPPQLFDVQYDTWEQVDLAPKEPESVDRLVAALRRLIDPEAVDLAAKADARAKIAVAGGADAVMRRGLRVPFSPVPMNFQA